MLRLAGMCEGGDSSGALSGASRADGERVSLNGRTVRAQDGARRQ